VRLVSRSRADIPSSAFDQNRPIIIDTGVSIVAPLPSDDQGSVPHVQYEGSMLKIGPDLIGKRQEILFTLLADGPTPALSCEAHLVNVTVRQQPSAARAITKIGRIFLVIVLCELAATFTLIGLGVKANLVYEALAWGVVGIMILYVVIIAVLQARYPE
jgi:hypothetical protein